MRKIKFNTVKSKNIGTGVETDIPAIKGEGVNYDEEINQLADEIEQVNDKAEHKTNKVSEITGENKDSEENYPSNKAVVDYVDSQRTYREVVLYDNPSGIEFYPQSPKTITLPNSIKDFDAICFTASFSGLSNYRNTTVIPVSSIIISDTIMTNTYCLSNRYEVPALKFTADNTIILVGHSSDTHMMMYRIVGIQYASSVKFEESVKDVQINGNSIVSDGVANIPNATTSSYGLVKPRPTSFWINNNGELILNEASDGAIDLRSSERPICTSRLDYAVKRAMCDGKGAEWTDAEKASARARIGVGGKFELIEEFTLGENVKTILKSVEPNGKPYKFRKVKLEMITNRDGNAKTVGISVNTTNGDYLDAKSLIRRSVTIIANSVTFCKSDIVCEDGLITADYCDTPQNTSRNPNGVYNYKAPMFLEGDFIESVGISTYQANELSGWTIRIYGVRA